MSLSTVFLVCLLALVSLASVRAAVGQVCDDGSTSLTDDDLTKSCTESFMTATEYCEKTVGITGKCKPMIENDKPCPAAENVLLWKKTGSPTGEPCKGLFDTCNNGKCGSAFDEASMNSLQTGATAVVAGVVGVMMAVYIGVPAVALCCTILIIWYCCCRKKQQIVVVQASGGPVVVAEVA